MPDEDNVGVFFGQHTGADIFGRVPVAAINF